MRLGSVVAQGASVPNSHPQEPLAMGNSGLSALPPAALTSRDPLPNQSFYGHNVPLRSAAAPLRAPSFQGVVWSWVWVEGEQWEAAQSVGQLLK